MDGSNVLQISALNPSHIGLYICEADNRFGSDGVYISVRRKPNGVYIVEKHRDKISSSDFDQLGKSGDARLPDIKIEFSDKTLIIEGKRVELFCDSGRVVYP